jgi:sigma-B regulation protein RsbU (phosphoserine phosphatase)
MALMLPFRTFKSLIVLLVIGVLLVTALAFMLFTRQEAARAMLAAEDEAALNVLHAVQLGIAAQHHDLEFFRRYALELRKRQLKDNVQLALAAVAQYRQLAAAGALAEAAARQDALRHVGGLRYGSNDYFFVYDSNLVAIAHPDPAIFGRNMADVKDETGRPMRAVIQDCIRDTGAGFCTIRWSRLGQSAPAEKLLYYVHYPDWNWIVGSGVYIDDIEADAQAKMQAIMETLRAVFARARVMETGYFWLFDGQGAILIPPRLPDGRPGPTHFPAAGTNLFEGLVRAARTPSQPYYHALPAAVQGGAPALICSHVQRFEPLDWYIVSSVATAELWKPVRRIIWKQTVFSALLVLVFILVALRLVGRVTRPLARLTDLADRIPRNNFTLPAEDTARLQAIVFPRELGRLARTLGSLLRKLQEYVANLAESTAARERLQSELRIAHDIQMNMLPDLVPEPASRAGIDLHAALVPASAVGGDLYDYFMLDDARLCVAVGDVSDKGVPAALFMARSKALIRAAAAERTAPDAILAKVNEELCGGNKRFMFVTVCLGILDLRTGEFVYSGAGHPPPYLLSGGPPGGCRPLPLTPHKPLGIAARAQYTSDRLGLAPGDCCFIYTDGITEAMNARAEQFGAERLQAVLGQAAGSGARETVAAVLSTVAGFADGIPQSDDIAILALRRRPDAVT